MSGVDLSLTCRRCLLAVAFLVPGAAQSEDEYFSPAAKRSYPTSLYWSVPMGGDLTSAPASRSPSFLVRAVKDPDGANLDRLQVITGWRDQSGKLHEKVYHVTLSGGRTPDASGNVPPVGNTVDVQNAGYRDSIGDPEPAVVWEDPDFDARELAFYYARVIEIPTPRWTAYDAKRFGITNIPKRAELVTQERAYTSPIWYTPE